MTVIKHEFPILEYDTEQRSVLQPNLDGVPNFPEKAVFPFLPSEVEIFALENHGRLLQVFESATKEFPIYECEYKGETVCMCQAPVGAAAAVQLMDYLIFRGVKKMISVGSCGTLVDLPENEFIVPTVALRDEGISYHYLPPSRTIAVSSEAIAAVEQALDAAGFPYMEAMTWSTDGFYRETEEMVKYRKEEGCTVVEMECAGLAACAQFRGITWGMILFTADTLADTENYDMRSWGEEAVPAALKLALDAVVLL